MASCTVPTASLSPREGAVRRTRLPGTIGAVTCPTTATATTKAVTEKRLMTSSVMLACLPLRNPPARWADLPDIPVQHQVVTDRENLLYVR